jgi:oligopeptide transport system ATP-binding protein
MLEVSDLKVHYPAQARAWGPHRAWLKAVDGVSFRLEVGETLGLVGESGCGKSTLGRAVVRLIEPTDGKVTFQGVDLAGLGRGALRAQRRRMQIIFQDPYSSLNPRMLAGDIVGEGLAIHKLGRTREERARRIASLFAAVGLDPSLTNRYPHEFSGGQRQRISIARALAVEPEFIVCDEPVSALDVSVQAQIITLLQDLQEQRKIAYLFIAHDLAVVEHISHRVMVMYLGKIVEQASAEQITRSPRHPYTQALLSAVPSIDPDSKRPRIVLPGETPSPIAPPAGCPFHPRCPLAEGRCRLDPPPLREVAPGHQVACHLA